MLFSEATLVILFVGNSPPDSLTTKLNDLVKFAQILDKLTEKYEICIKDTDDKLRIEINRKFSDSTFSDFCKSE